MDPITLVAINSRYSQSNLALRYLSTVLETPWNLIEWDINRPPRELIEKLVTNGSSSILFSAYIWNSVYLKHLIPDLAALLPEATISIGGPEAVYNPDDWLKLRGLSFILDGNAENFAGLLPNLKKTNYAELLRTPRHPFSETQFPYTAEELSKLKGRIIYYEASRGCRFNCSYCLSATVDGGVDYRSDTQITNEIALLSRFEGTVKFVDRTFNADSGKAHLIWRLMADNPPAGCFHFEIHPALLQEEDFEMIKNLSPGTAQFEIGIQSTNPDILRNVNRYDEPKQSFENIRRLVNIDGLHIHLDQIIGLPGDSPQTAAQSLDEIISLKPDMFQPGFLKILPGTPLAENAEKFGIKASALPPYEIIESSSFSFEMLQHFHRIEQLVKRLYNNGFFRLTLSKIAGQNNSWFTLFESLLDTSCNQEAADTNCNRWEYWGRRIFNYTNKIMPESSLLIKDLLRLDWCPNASSQYYPDFISYNNDKKTNQLKTAACRKILLRDPELKKSSLKRSIIFIPESSLSELPVDGAVLFVRHAGRMRRMNIDLKEEVFKK